MKLLRRAMLAAFVALCLSPAVGRAQNLTPIKIGVVRLTGSVPIYVALDEGYFKQQGLDAQLVWLDASATVATATVSGDIDFGSAAFTGALFNLGAKGTLTMIASQLRDAPNYHLNALMATTRAYNAGFTKITDLPGKRIGMTTFGSTMQYTVGLLSKKYGFDLSKVTMVPLQSLSNLNAAFAGDQVDGGVIGAAAAKQFVATGAGRIICWTGDEAPWQLGAQVTSPKLLKEHPDVAVRFLKAYLEGVATYQKAVQFDRNGTLIKGPGYEQVADIIAKYLEIKPEQVADIFPSFDPHGALDIADVKNQVAFYQSQNMVDKTADVDKMVDLSYLAKAQGK